MTRIKETLETLSRKTGYSTTTVSRVLAGKAEQYRISKEAVRIIKREAEKSDFIPSSVAQSLRTHRTNTIGLVIPSVDNQYFAHLAHVIIEEARERGLMTIILSSMEDESNERIAIRSLVSRKVDGIILVHSGTDPFFAEETDETIPIVLIDRYYTVGSRLSYVGTDNYQGACDAMRYLVDNGHRRIACIQGPEDSSPVRERTRGYQDVLDQVDPDGYRCIAGDSFTVENGYMETKFLLNSDVPPTAVFALSNTILLGAVPAARESKGSVPGDLSLICFDDNVFMDYLSPAVTRIGQPTYEIGVLATKLLIKRMNGADIRENRILLPPKLILGQSVRSI